MYRTIDELIRDGMFARIECRKCRFAQSVDPDDIKNYISTLYRSDAMQRAHGWQPFPHGNPDMTLSGCVDGLKCPTCKASDWMVDAIKPPRGNDDEH